MTSGYQEFAPRPTLLPFVECFWRHQPSLQPYPVLPDACIDIVFSRAIGLQLVGTMTRPLLAPAAYDGVVGVRFRPGMARPLVAASASELTDGLVPLIEVWGKRGRALEEQLRNAWGPEQMLPLLQAELRPPCHISPVQRAIEYLARNAGSISLQDICRHAGLSERQLRRRCLEETGITPKQLARIARFRRACSGLHTRSRWASLALECGYYDQSHFIHEFQAFSGQTPAQYVAGR